MIPEARLPVWQYGDQASGVQLLAYHVDGQLHDAIAPFGGKPQRCHVVGDKARLERLPALRAIDVAQVPRVLRRVATEGQARTDTRPSGLLGAPTALIRSGVATMICRLGANRSFDLATKSNSAVS